MKYLVGERAWLGPMSHSLSAIAEVVRHVLRDLMGVAYSLNTSFGIRWRGIWDLQMSLYAM
jgi:hypothetical protein